MDNTNIICDIKCIHHSQKDIILVCLECDNQPICSLCLTSNHKQHNFENIENINKELKTSVITEFNKETLQQLNKYTCDIKSLLKDSDIKIKQIEDRHLVNIELVQKQFKQLHNILNITETDIIKQLVTKLDENKETNTTINSSLDSIIKVINNIINSSGTINDYNNNEGQFIQILKYNYQCKSILKDSIGNLPKYNITTVSTNQVSIDSIKDTVKSIILIDKIQLKTIKYCGNEYIVYEDEGEIPEGTTNLAIGHGHHLPNVFPDSVSWVLLPDGFDCQSLKSLPPTVLGLDIFDIKYKLLPGSIPNSIDFIAFGDGFSQKIVKGIIPNSVKTLYICDIIHPLNNDSIPNTVEHINISKSFKHSIKEMFPKNSLVSVKSITNEFSVKYKY